VNERNITMVNHESGEFQESNSGVEAAVVGAVAVAAETDGQMTEADWERHVETQPYMGA
jgi:hypothetical protein